MLKNLAYDTHSQDLLMVDMFQYQFITFFLTWQVLQKLEIDLPHPCSLNSGQLKNEYLFETRNKAKL
jgi:hypothetical protein